MCSQNKGDMSQVNGFYIDNIDLYQIWEISWDIWMCRMREGNGCVDTWSLWIMKRVDGGVRRMVFIMGVYIWQWISMDSYKRYWEILKDRCEIEWKWKKRWRWRRKNEEREWQQQGSTSISSRHSHMTPICSLWGMCVITGTKMLESLLSYVDWSSR